MTKASRKLTILLVIASLGLVFSGCVKKPMTNTNTDQPTNTNQAGEIDTSDWQTYQNEEYEFEFKYPVDWDTGLLNDGRITIKPVGKSGYEYVGDIVVKVRHMGSVGSLESFYASENNGPFRVSNYSIKVISNYQVYYFNNFPGMTPSDLYIFKFNNLALEFYVYNSENSIAEGIIDSLTTY